MKTKSLLSTSSKISIRTKEQLGSSLQAEQLKFLNDHLVTVFVWKDGVDQSIDSRIGKWSETEH